MILRCREWRWFDRTIAAGSSKRIVYISLAIMAFFASIFTLVLVLFIELILLDPWGKNATAVNFIGACVGCYLFYCGLFYWTAVRPRPPRYPLLLCEEGIRFRGRVVRFADIQIIRYGYRPKGLRALHLSYCRFHASLPWFVNPVGIGICQSLENQFCYFYKYCSLTIFLKDGCERSLLNMANLLRPEEVKRFFDSMYEKHGDLMDRDSYPGVPPPDVLDRHEIH